LLAFLGILPMRDDGEAGVEIRYVFPQSPAEKAKLQVGDRILKLESRPILTRNQLMSILDVATPGQQVKFDVKRNEGGKTETITGPLAKVTEVVPGDRPPGEPTKKGLRPPKPPMMLPMGPMGQPQPQPRPPIPAPPPKQDKDKPAEPKKDAKT